MQNPFRSNTDAIEEHHIVLGNGIIEISFHHASKTVFYLDQTTGASDQALGDLLEHLRSQGWFLHAVTVLPSTIRDTGGVT